MLILPAPRARSGPEDPAFLHARATWELGGSRHTGVARLVVQAGSGPSLPDARSSSPPPLGLGDDLHVRLEEVATGLDPVHRHPGPAHARPKSGLALVDPVAEPGPEPRIGGIDEKLLAGLRVLDHDQTDLGERFVGTVDHPQRDDVVSVREPDERMLPLWSRLPHLAPVRCAAPGRVRCRAGRCGWCRRRATLRRRGLRRPGYRFARAPWPG